MRSAWTVGNPTRDRSTSTALSVGVLLSRFVIVALLCVVSSAHADPPGAVEQLRADRSPGGTIRWTWNPTPAADRYDIIGGALSVGNLADAACRTAEDSDPADTMFDDAVSPGSGSGEYLLARAVDVDGDGPGSYDSAAGNEGRWNTACDQPEAYFCVADATGDSFVMKLIEQDKIDHARNVIRGTEQERVHVGALSTGGPVPWNPGWQFHIPPDDVYFFSQAHEICDASIAAVDQGGPPAGTWCPWTSQILGELLHPDQWQGSTPAPFYCGPAS